MQIPTYECICWTIISITLHANQSLPFSGIFNITDIKASWTDCELLAKSSAAHFLENGQLKEDWKCLTDSLYKLMLKWMGILKILFKKYQLPCSDQIAENSGSFYFFFFVLNSHLLWLHPNCKTKNLSNSSRWALVFRV